MFPWLQAITKIMALVKAIQSDPALLAAIQDVIALFPQKQPTTGGQPQMMAEYDQTALRAAFDNSSEVHSVLTEIEGATPGAKSAIDIGGLFNIFTQLLPLIMQILNAFKKPAVT